MTLRCRFFMHNLPTSCTDKNFTHAAIAIQTYISNAKYYSELDQETELLQVEGVKYGLQMFGIAAHSRSNLLLFAICGVSRKHPYPALLSRCVAGNFVPDHVAQDCAWQHRL